MDLYEVVTKLIGKIEPVGETYTDDRRFENLKSMTRLVDKLIYDIDALTDLKDRKEFSIQRAGVHCDKFLTQLGIEE